MSCANQNTTYPPVPFFRRLTWDGVFEWILPSRTLKRRAAPLLLGVLYIVVIGVLGGLKPDHFLLGLLPLLDSYNEHSRKFFWMFLPFTLTGVVYDSMRYFYWQGIAGHVHVAEPYYRDLHYFSVPTWFSGAERPLTMNEYFALHPHVALDLLCGFAYLVFVAEYLSAAMILFFRERWQTLRIFGWSFFTVNVLGFITYFIYPAAPPWYVSQYGLGPARMNVHPNAAAASRFDHLLGTHFFDEMYGKGVDVYGAYPSLHVAYPLLTAIAIFSQPDLRWARIPAVAFYLLMCLSAMYLQHHYVMDILLGTTYACVTAYVLARLSRRLSSCFKI